MIGIAEANELRSQIPSSEHPATSLARFFDAHRAAYRRMLATGDIGDHRPAQIDKGMPKAAHNAMARRQTEQAIERIRKGEPLTHVAHSFGISEKTLQTRLHKRGLSVRKIRNQ